VTAENAAKAGSAVTIYCTGLGEVSPAFQAGNAGPPLPGGAATVTPVTVAIGNVNAPVHFTGLAPVAPGNAVPVTLTVQTTPAQSSLEITMAVQ